MLDRPPVGTRAAGRRVWESVLSEFELDEHEVVILREVVRTVDQLDQLDAAVRRDGVLVEAGVKAHPALVEARQQRMVLARLVAALRLPETAADLAARPQRRDRPRGVYAVSSGGRVASR